MADSVPDGSSVGDGAAKEKVNQNSCPSFLGRGVKALKSVI